MRRVSGTAGPRVLMLASELPAVAWVMVRASEGGSRCVPVSLACDGVVRVSTCGAELCGLGLWGQSVCPSVPCSVLVSCSPAILCAWRAVSSFGAWVDRGVVGRGQGGEPRRLRPSPALAVGP